MKLVLQLISKSLWKYVLAVLISTIAGVAGAIMIKHIHSGMKKELDDQFLLVFAVLLIVSVVLGVIGSQMLTKLSENNLKELRVSLSRRIMKSSYQKIEGDTDKLIPILTTEIATIGSAAAKIPDVITSLAIIVGCLVYMFFLSWQYTLFAVGIFGVNFIMTVFVMPLTRKHENSAKELRFELFRHLKDMVIGLKELSFKRKLRQVYVNKLIEPTIEKQNAIKLKNTLVINSFAKIETVLVMSTLALGIYVIRSTAGTTTAFVEFLALALFLIAPMTKINAFFRIMNRTTIALESIENLGLDLKGFKKPKPQRVPTENWSAKDPIVEFQNVNLSYSTQEAHESFKLGPISFKVHENEIVFIIGGNGSGKTTLIKTLTGLYSPEEGSIIYKNCAINGEYMDDYQNQFSALFSDDFVFRILYHINQKQLESNGDRYLDLLELSGKVKIVDQQFSTVNLSYGQRKRLNLVMALLEDKEIYVFDEWAANQDPYFKSLFYSHILGDLKAAGKTIFVISHDDSYFHLADRIVKLQDGQIVANELQSKVS